MNKRFLVVLAMLGTARAFGQTLPLDPAVRSGKLPNGFTYYIRHNEEPKKRVVLYLANKVGSILETDAQRGLAHFMEHMSFNGTKHFPKNELVNYLQKSGVRFGADINAYTSFDETVYQLPLPSDDAQVLSNGLLIMRDWANGATLDAAEIDKERGVILEEKRLGQGAGERMRRRYYPVLLNNSRYAKRLPIGTEEVLTNFKPATIRAYYKDWYRPDLQALIVVGDINVADMEKRIKTLFGDLKSPAAKKVRTKYTVPLLGKNQFISVTDKEQTATVAQLIIKHKAPELKTAADYRNLILRSLYNQMLSARFAELTRQADPPFVQGSAGISGLLGGLDSFNASVVSTPAELEKSVKAAWREVLRVKNFGFTQTELDRAKASYLSRMSAALKEKDKTSSQSYVNEYLQYFLKQEAAPGIATEFALVEKQLPGIILTELISLSQAYIKNSNRDILLLAPEKEKANLPNEATLTNWLKAVETEKLAVYDDGASAGELLSAAPIAGRIISEQKDEFMTTLRLSNGATVILKPTNFKNDEIRFMAFGPGGTSLAADADFQSAANASSVISSFGAGNYNPSQLQKFMAGKQVQVQTYINERNQGIAGASVNNDLETAFQLIYARFTASRRDTALFKNIISRSRANLVNRGDDPASVFQDSVNAILGNYNIRRTGPNIAKLEQIRLDRSYDFYKARFIGASGFTFVFVGSINDNIKDLITKYIASLPAGNATEAKDLGIHIPVGRIEKTVYKGSENKASVRLVFSGLFDYNEGNKVQLDALKECLQLRLIERLREDEGGVYSPSVSASTSKYPQARYSFSVTFGCSPANVDKLIASTLDEIGKLKSSGPPQSNIDKYIAEERRQEEVQLRSNDFWLNYLGQQLQDKESLEEYKNSETYWKALNPEKLKAAANQYLSGDNYIRLVLLPEKK